MRSGGTVVRIGACIAALCLACAAVPNETAPAAAPDETAPAAAPEADVRKLMNYGVALARQILGEYSAFHPFAFVMETNGKIGQVALSEGRDHEGSLVLTTLLEILQVQAAEGRYRAVVIMADVTITLGDEETDAIRAGLEHASGYCVNIYFPYERSEEGALKLGEALSEAREGAVFGPCGQATED